MKSIAEKLVDQLDKECSKGDLVALVFRCPEGAWNIFASGIKLPGVRKHHAVLFVPEHGMDLVMQVKAAMEAGGEPVGFIIFDDVFNPRELKPFEGIGNLSYLEALESVIREEGDSIRKIQ